MFPFFILDVDGRNVVATTSAKQVHQFDGFSVVDFEHIVLLYHFHDFVENSLSLKALYVGFFHPCIQLVFLPVYHPFHIYDL